MNGLWMFALLILVTTSPGWGIVLAGYVMYKIDWRRMERNCPACQDRSYPTVLMPDEWRQSFCMYHKYRYGKIEKLEEEVLPEYPFIAKS